MKLSIVIVNYNVEYFLEQCLRSVYRSLGDIPSEVFVVDNDSSDGSIEMVKKKFPEVILIHNKKNLGFSKANNQAIRKAKGEMILLLNPDTVVEEDTFETTLKFMDDHPDAGALGVKMIDGKGNFLPESKRGLPTPAVSFYKIFGLTSLFPKSKKFARYYMGHLDPAENHKVDVLAGAFMLLRKEALDKSGLLDEDFFMYGEDIDLSYRITKAGYNNYYVADTSIIHYKGESTKKGSLNYVYVFYRAMIIFAQKHFADSNAKIFETVIQLAIYLRAGLSLLSRFIKWILVPLTDVIVLLLGLWYIKDYWESNHRFIQGGEYSIEIVSVAFTLYCLTWIISMYLSGAYERPAKISNILKGIFTGSIIILVGYSLVDEQYRFSRAIILLGSFWAAIMTPSWRFLMQKISGIKLLSLYKKNRRIAIAGSLDEARRVEQLIKQTSDSLSYVGYVDVGNGSMEGESKFIGELSQLTDICRIFSIDEVIFCSRDLSGKDIFKQMALLNPLKMEIKIAPSESEFVIGSNSINSQGSWYTIQFNEISKPSNRKAKRLFDALSSLLLLATFPLNIWFVKRKGGYLGNLFLTLFGRTTWVGYDKRASISHLPELKPSILKTTSELNSPGSDAAINHINQLYAKDYNFWVDLRILLRSLRKTGNQWRE